MKKTLIILLIFFTENAFSQDSIRIKVDSLKKETLPISSDSILKQSSLKVDTTILDFNKKELIIPISTNNLTKVVMVKEKTKVDWLKYLLPIFTLLLGIWLKEFIEKRSGKKKITKSGERWVAELRSIEEPLKKQIQNLEEYLIGHKKEVFEIPNLQIYSSLNGEIFKSLDKNELIQYIESKYKNSDYKDIVKISNRTHGYISILINLNSTLREKFEKYLSQTSIYVEALNKNLQSFNVAFAEYGVEIEKEIKKDPIYDDRYKPIAGLYSTFILPHLEDGKFNPFVLKTEFFLPVISHLSKYRMDPITKPLLLASNDSLNNIKGINMEKHYMTEIINTILKRYNDLLKNLNDIVNAIEKH